MLRVGLPSAAATVTLRAVCSNAVIRTAATITNRSHRHINRSTLPSSSSILSSSSSPSPLLPPSHYFHTRAGLFSSTSGAPSSPARYVIYFGSQTGTAMGFAHQLAKQLKKTTDAQGNKASVTVVDLANFSPHEFRAGGFHLFITACFGSGEPTENARSFHRWLLSSAPADSGVFNNVSFAFFGLGQSRNYPERYQLVTKEFDKRMGELGGVRMLPRAEGDSSVDVEADFDSWSENVMTLIKNIKEDGQKWNAVMAPPANELGAAPAAIPAAAATAAPAAIENKSASATPTPTSCSTSPTSENSCASTSDLAAALAAEALANGSYVPDARHPVLVPIVRHTQFKPKSLSPFSSTLSPMTFPREAAHIEMDLSTQPFLRFTSGDYVGVYPANTDTTISAFLNRLGLSGNHQIEISRHKELLEQCPSLRLRVIKDETNIPLTLPLFDILKWGIDLLSVPRRSLVKELAAAASIQEEAAKLRFLGEDKSLGKKDYAAWVVGDGRNVLDILKAFKSITLSTNFGIDELLDLLPPLSCRFYSIASSNKETPERLSILSSRVAYLSNVNYQQRNGLSSNMLWNSCLGNELSVFIKPSLFRMPSDITKPILMICAGAGIAPFRAFIHERVFLFEQAKLNNTPLPGKAMLIFGCEARQEDYWFGEEFEGYQQKYGSDFLQVIPAFSHEQAWRIYAPYKMVEDEISKQIYQLIIDNQAHIYVCGSASRLAPPVQDALISILSTHGSEKGFNETSAATLLKNMQANGSYQLDAF